MEDQRAAVRVKIPRTVVPDAQVHGVFANHIQQMSTDTESILDFALIVPSQYERADDGNLRDVEVVADVVARIIVPREQFREFLRASVSKQPELFRDILVAAQEGDKGDE